MFSTLPVTSNMVFNFVYGCNHNGEKHANSIGFVYRPCIRVHGRIRGPWLCTRAMYTCTRPFTSPCTRAVSMAVYGPCTRTRPCTGRPCVRPCTHSSACMPPVYTACPCRVHGRLHDVYTGRVGAMYTYATVYMAVYTVVYGPCTGR